MDAAVTKMLLDPYGSWCKAEGVPVIEDFGIDLLAVPTAPWPRMGCDGAIAHLKGRGDFVAVFVLDLPPGGKTESQRHCYEEVVYVLSGHGSTVIETDEGKHSFHFHEWVSCLIVAIVAMQGTNDICTTRNANAAAGFVVAASPSAKLPPC